MKQLTCEMCGSTELVKEDGYYACQVCGTKYSIEEAKKLMLDGPIQIDHTNEIDPLETRVFDLIAAREFDKANECCEKILAISPQNIKASLASLLIKNKTVNIVCCDKYSETVVNKLLNCDDEEIKKQISVWLDWQKKHISFSDYDDKGLALNGLTDNLLYRDELEEVVIPETINGKPVLMVMDSAFSHCENLRRVVLPSSVDYIGEDAFFGCERLDTVVLPKTCEYIGKGVFTDCESLIEVKYPEGDSIPEDAFSNCKNLKQITIPETVTVISSGAFYGCESLVEIILPSCLEHVFSGRYTSSHEYMPDSKGAFEGCVNLKRVTVLSRNESIFSDRTFFDCPSLETVICENVSVISSSPYKVVFSAFSNHDINVITNGIEEKMHKIEKKSEKSGGCYVATAVYGSYDCPQVWTLRRYRDYTLAETWYGRAFIKTYYAISPTLVKWFGHTEWFKKMWKGKLDRMVDKLQANGVESTPYEDKEWLR